MDTKPGNEGLMFNPPLRRSAVLRALLEKFLENGDGGGKLRPDRPAGEATHGKAGAPHNSHEEGERDGKRGFPRTNGAQ